MKNAFYAALAVVPWVVLTLILRWLIGRQEYPVGLVGLVSRLISLPLLLIWIMSTGNGLRRLNPRGQATRLAVMGLVAIVINLTWFNAVRWTTATNINMLIRLDVLFVILLGASLGLERIGKAQVALLGPMLFGLALLIEIQKFDWGGHLWGDLLTVIAAFAYSVNAFIIRGILQVMEEDSVAFYNHAGSGLGFLILVLVNREFTLLTDPSFVRAAWLPLLVVGLLVAVSLPLYYFALHRMHVWRLRMYMLAGPVLTAAIEWPLWSVRLTPLQCTGGLIILASLALLVRWELQQARAAAPAVVRPAPAHDPHREKTP